jgi:hypothetical protein
MFWPLFTGADTRPAKPRRVRGSRGSAVHGGLGPPPTTVDQLLPLHLPSCGGHHPRPLASGPGGHRRRRIRAASAGMVARDSQDFVVKSLNSFFFSQDKMDLKKN